MYLCSCKLFHYCKHICNCIWNGFSCKYIFYHYICPYRHIWLAFGLNLSFVTLQQFWHRHLHYQNWCQIVQGNLWVMLEIGVLKTNPLKHPILYLVCSCIHPPNLEQEHGDGRFLSGRLLSSQCTKSLMSFIFIRFR